MRVWLACAVIPVACLLLAFPGLLFTYYLGCILVYAGPVVGLVALVGGERRRRRIRRELLAGDDDLNGDVELNSGVELNTVATDAADFRRTRQIVLFLNYAVVAALGIVALLAVVLEDSTASLFALGPLALVGAVTCCVAPSWVFSRDIVLGEEHALRTRSGSWRLIRALRLMSLVIGGVAIALSLYAAVALPLGGLD